MVSATPGETRLLGENGGSRLVTIPAVGAGAHHTSHLIPRQPAGSSAGSRRSQTGTVLMVK